MPGRFTRNIEDFTCENCGFEVKGNGYTDHCPKCLWGKHVDNNPGDRGSKCKGMLVPLHVEAKGSEKVIEYRCSVCKAKKRFGSSPQDNEELLLELMN